MSVTKKLDMNLAEVRRLALELWNAPQIPLTDRKQIPKMGGVYIFHEKRQGKKAHMIYVGLASNLRRRIHTDHVSAESKDTMSAFRKSLSQIRKLKLGAEIKTWLQTNCTIAFLTIEDADMRRMVEAVLVKCIRSPELFNKP